MIYDKDGNDGRGVGDERGSEKGEGKKATDEEGGRGREESNSWRGK